LAQTSFRPLLCVSMGLTRSLLVHAVCAACQLQPVLASYQLLRTGASSSSGAYESFRHEYGRTIRAELDSVSYETRLRHFEESLAEVKRLNARKDATWVAVVNRFADYTPAERRALLGYRRALSSRAGEVPASFLETREGAVTVAKSRDWRTEVAVSKGYVQDQGSCGSCWAVAAVGALEMHAELAGASTKPLSYEQLVDCVENLRHCGGGGHCSGATAELAFDYVSKHGIVQADDYTGGYQRGDNQNGYQCRASAAAGPPAVHASGFVSLPRNKVAPLLEFLSSTGPITASVDATTWTQFGSGVFTDCPRDATVNHAVLLLGYGRAHDLGNNNHFSMDYWLIRNSWGKHWGEDGHIRLQRHEKDTGKAGHCGTDPDNQQGVGCDGDPKEVPVCGMCGVLFDTVYPTGVVVSSVAKL